MSTIEKALERLKEEKSCRSSSESLSDNAFSTVIGIEKESSEVLPAVFGEKEKEGGESRTVKLDLEGLAEKGFLTHDGERSQLAEEMRHIKRSLVINASKKSGEAYSNLIMVTSAKPSEGKTYTSLNLAISIAKERDKTVLLVDGDVAKPGVSRVLNLTKEVGLVEYLVDGTLEVSDVMLKTNIENLRFIPAGKRHIHSTELLASERMQRLLQGFCERYEDRIIIFDSPPLLATSEAAVLTEFVGQVVMVVEAEKTTKQEVEEALTLIKEGVMVGLVLNKSLGSYGSDYYGTYGD